MADVASLAEKVGNVELSNDSNVKQEEVIEQSQPPASEGADGVEGQCDALVKSVSDSENVPSSIAAEEVSATDDATPVVDADSGDAPATQTVETPTQEEEVAENTDVYWGFSLFETYKMAMKFYKGLCCLVFCYFV